MKCSMYWSNISKRNEINMGPGYNRLMGYNMAKGDFVIFMDDDDYYIDDLFFYKAYNILINDNTLSFVSGNSFIKRDNNISLIESQMNISGFINGIDYLNGFQFKYSKPHSFRPNPSARAPTSLFLPIRNQGLPCPSV